MTEKPVVHRLGHQLEDVSRLRPHLAARRADLEAEVFQDRINFYAVDTNVVYFCAQPIAYVPAAQRSAGVPAGFAGRQWGSFARYGSVFRTDPPQTHATVCATLARFIGFELGGGAPLYVPPSLDAEIDGLDSYLLGFENDDAIGGLGVIVDTLLVEILATLQRYVRPQLIELHRASIETRLAKIVYLRVGRPNGVNRLDEMRKAGRIASLEWIDAKRLLLRRYQKLGDLARGAAPGRHDMEAAWKKALVATGKPNNPKLDNDARALADVEAWNALAIEEGRDERLLYLTADTRVHMAGHALRIGNGMTFTEAYLRHPIGFLDDIGMGVRRRDDIGGDEGGSFGTSLLDWLDVLLADYSEGSGIVRSDASAPEPTVLARIEAFEREHPDESKRIEASWRELSAAQEVMLLDRLALRDLVEDVERHAAKSNGDGDSLIDEYRSALADRAFDEEAAAWETCFEAAAELTLKGARQNRQRTRSSPPICFEGWPQAGEAVEQFKYWGSNEPFNERELKRYRKRLEDEDEDNTKYAYYLAFAALFAGRGEWEAAAALAAFAREVVLRTPELGRTGANGREAAFMEAACRRHLAQVPQDLSRSVELLSEARAVLARESATAGLALKIVPERFDLEEIDIEQMRFFFKWHAGQNAASAELAMDAVRLLRRYAVLQRELAAQIDLQSAIYRRGEVRLGSVEHVMLQTEIRTILSALTVFSIDIVPQAAGEVDLMARFLFRLEELRGRALAPGGGKLSLAPERSFLAEIVVPVATILVRRSGRKAPRLEDSPAKTARRLAGSSAHMHQQYPFDKKRFAKMQAILAQAGS